MSSPQKNSPQKSPQKAASPQKTAAAAPPKRKIGTFYFFLQFIFLQDAKELSPKKPKVETNTNDKQQETEVRKKVVGIIVNKYIMANDTSGRNII